MVLPEVIRGSGPVRAVGHLPAVCHVVAVGILLKQIAVAAVCQRLVERVIAAQASIVEVLIGLDACGQVIAP